MSISSGAPRPLGAAYIPILLSEVEQEQRPSGNGDREAIVVGAGLCDGEGERAYTGYAPHIIRNVSANVFSLGRFSIFFCRNVRRHVFAETSGIRIKRASDISLFHLVPRGPLGPLMFPSCQTRSNRSKDLAGTEIAKQS